MESRTIGQTTVYVSSREERIGSEGPFHVVFADEDGSERWGYLCTACDSFDTAMDTMGRIVCNECGNIRKPEEWDAAHS